jgi:hypothetical protein
VNGPGKRNIRATPTHSDGSSNSSSPAGTSRKHGNVASVDGRGESNKVLMKDQKENKRKENKSEGTRGQCTGDLPGSTLSQVMIGVWYHAYNVFAYAWEAQGNNNVLRQCATWMMQPAVYGALFLGTDICTRGCHWFPRLLAGSEDACDQWHSSRAVTLSPFVAENSVQTRKVRARQSCHRLSLPKRPTFAAF